MQKRRLVHHKKYRYWFKLKHYCNFQMTPSLWQELGWLHLMGRWLVIMSNQVCAPKWSVARPRVTCISNCVLGNWHLNTIDSWGIQHWAVHQLSGNPSNPTHTHTTEILVLPWSISLMISGIHYWDTDFFNLKQPLCYLAPIVLYLKNPIYVDSFAWIHIKCRPISWSQSNLEKFPRIRLLL